ncbi:MAG: sulfatase arylsulfatase [Planctomycetota bacterium]|nr:MAG: sulfatase arylsulfatase [Planctomycetota bacterium]KAB2949295.1 MAG: sulfatase arylsulfatase [Phycisphaerae bacterium]MCQ3919764.1 sulfatase arylsulfatase [Planctomycetota bacterium]
MQNAECRMKAICRTERDCGSTACIADGLRSALLVALAFVGLVLPGCGEKASKAEGKKVIVLGLDGMDPRLLRRLMDEGRMPTFSKLAAKGGFWELGTSVPPQSPVAWSNFIVGGDPGAHGVFDFIHREFEDGQILPYYSTNETTYGEKPYEMFGFYMPMPWQESSKLLLKRGGKPFWDYLDEKGIPSRLYRIPANYPPSESKHGYVKALSGMGTTDLMGTQGTFQWFSAEFDDDVGSPDDGGRAAPLKYDMEMQRWHCKLAGIPNPMVIAAQGAEMTIPIYIEPDREESIARISYVNQAPKWGMDQPVEFLLREGEWSDWKPVVFLPSPFDPGGGAGSRGIVRFQLRKADPPELYVTPINFDPAYPSGKITEPDDFAQELAKGVGPFYTKGFAEDFHAREAKIKIDLGGYATELRLFDDEDYKTQTQFVMDEGKKLLTHALSEYKDGLLFFYFSSTDLVGHVFYWEPEPGEPEEFTDHPVRDDEDAETYTKSLRETYVQCDAELAKVLEKAGDDATVFVMSDHGFMRYKRKLNLNTWLLENGFISLKDEEKRRGSLNDLVDWSKTKAYSFGLNAIYLNLKGREPQGAVDPKDRDAVLREISDKLRATRDPLDERPVVKTVYRTDEVYHGDYAPGGKFDQHTPDLIVGLHREYVVRLGGTGDLSLKWIYNNTGEWSADHCIAAELVPGILLSNRKITVTDPNLTDLAPTILAEFGIEKPEKMTGRNLFAPPK